MCRPIGRECLLSLNTQHITGDLGATQRSHIHKRHNDSYHIHMYLISCNAGIPCRPNNLSIIQHRINTNHTRTPSILKHRMHITSNIHRMGRTRKRRKHQRHNIHQKRRRLTTNIILGNIRLDPRNSRRLPNYNMELQ